MMKPSGRAFRISGFNPDFQAMAPQLIRHEMQPGKPKTIRALAKAFLKYRAAKLAADPSVDTYFNRGESVARFAYFDE